MNPTEPIIVSRSIRRLRTLVQVLLPFFALLAFALAGIAAWQAGSALGATEIVLAAVGFGCVLVGLMALQLENSIQRDVSIKYRELEEDYLLFLRSQRDLLEQAKRAEYELQRRESLPENQ